MMTDRPRSIYHLIKEIVDQDLPATLCSKATLVHISHTLEDMVLSHQLPAMLFTGFQESSHWRKETKRYQAIASIAQQVCIFAGKPLPPDSVANALHIELADGDDLRQEWFLIILSSEFAVVLAGEDQETAVATEAERLFETLWSFEPEIVNATLDLLETVIADYRPGKLATVRATRRRFSVPPPNPTIVTQLVNELLRYEEQLRQSLETSRAVQARLLGRLQFEHDRLQRLLEHVPSGLLLLDNDWRIQLVNNLGRTYLNTLATLTDDDQLVALGDLMLADIQEQAQQVLPLTIIENGRLHHYYEIMAQPITLNATIEWLIVIRDLTHEKQMEAHLQTQEKLGALGQMAAGLAHNFNNLLTSIITSAELITLTAEDTKNTQRAEAIVSQGMSMATDVGQLLDFSRKTILMQRPLDLADHLSNYLDSLPDNLPASIHLKTKLPQRAITVSADSDSLRQLWRNLVQNAVEAMPFGGKLGFQLEDETFSAGTLPLPDMLPGQWAKITVSDTGVGIQPDVLSQIFTPFFTTKDVGKGTGLGLSQVYGIVKQHNGQITAASASGNGATFTIYLPISVPGLAPDA